MELLASASAGLRMMIGLWIKSVGQECALQVIA
jgi:hypothetical protein